MQQSHPKVVNPRDMTGEHQKKKKKKEKFLLLFAVVFKDFNYVQVMFNNSLRHFLNYLNIV